jgi:hypothetical protein
MEEGVELMCSLVAETDEDARLFVGAVAGFCDFCEDFDIRHDA